ncbi:MAG: DUF721 domain-containing protein [Candidatus Krumholzibacteriota bacterium]|nr:DUF721 domain-containing protein [Candidatus Krumholzibacteriota bacterium]
MPAERGSKSIDKILPDVIKGLGIEEKFEEASLRAGWKEVVGDGVAARSRPLDIRGGTLFIAVKNNVWMQEMSFHRTRIIDGIKQRFPRLKIREIRLVIEREKTEE